MMSLSKDLLDRSNNTCELCNSTDELQTYLVPPKSDEIVDNQIALCSTCISQLDDPGPDVNHWRCLNESMWSEVPAVQVVAHRMLKKLNSEGWAQDLLGMMYMDDDTLAWAEDGIEKEDQVIHKDSNGHVLEAGDSVVLIKDLNVKGANFTAKRGTAVRRISLVHDNAEHIEGRVNDQHIVILTKFVKKV